MSGKVTALEKLKGQVESTRESATKKQRRFMKNPRFEKAHQYWTGVRMTCDAVIFNIEEAIKLEVTQK